MSESGYRSPDERWGTCCPFDPECEHSFLNEDALDEHLCTPISDDEAAALSEGSNDE